MSDTTINLSRHSVAALPIGTLQPERSLTLSRLFTIDDTEPEPKVIPPPGWRIHGRARRDGNLIYAIIPDPEQSHSTMPCDQSLVHKYAEFFEYDQASPCLGMPGVSTESIAKFSSWLAALMTDDISGIPSLTDFEKDALPALRTAWQDATDAVTNAVSMRPLQNPLPDADFLFQIAEPDTAQVAAVRPISDRARQYVSRQNQTFPDRFISGHHPSMRRVLEYEGFRVAEAP